MAKQGRETELGTDWCIGYTTYIDDLEERTVNNERRYLEGNFKMFVPLGLVRGLSGDQMSDLGPGSKPAKTTELPTLEEAVTAGLWLCSRPKSVKERREEVQDRYFGLEQVNVGSVIGTPLRI